MTIATPDRSLWQQGNSGGQRHPSTISYFDFAVASVLCSIPALSSGLTANQYLYFYIFWAYWYPVQFPRAMTAQYATSEEVARQEGLTEQTPLLENNESDPEKVPEGGLVAWTQVAMGHLVIFNCWGYITSFGFFQQYYLQHLDQSPSAISFVGSMQMFLLNFVGIFSGRAVDMGYFRQSLILGCTLQVLGLFSTAIATEYWQIFLAQGVCTGLGHGFLFAPIISILPTYFKKNRALAVSLATCGAATGGMVFPTIAYTSLNRLGFKSTVAIMGLVVAFNASMILTFTRTRIKPRKPRSLLDLSAFAELPFTLFAVGSFLILWGVYFAYFYVGAFARSVLDFTLSQSLAVIILMNGIGIFGRVFGAILADRYFGILNTLISAVGITGILLLGWIGVTTINTLFGWAAIYGIAANATQSLFPAAVGSLSKDPTRVGTRVGMILGVVSISCFTGPPIGGALIALNDGEFLYAQLFGGLTLLGGCLFYVAVALITRWRLWKEAAASQE